MALADLFESSPPLRAAQPLQGLAGAGQRADRQRGVAPKGGRAPKRGKAHKKGAAPKGGRAPKRGAAPNANRGRAPKGGGAPIRRGSPKGGMAPIRGSVARRRDKPITCRIGVPSSMHGRAANIGVVELSPGWRKLGGDTRRRVTPD